MSSRRLVSSLSVGSGVVLALGGLGLTPAAAASPPHGTPFDGHAVFVQTNGARGNAVIAYGRGRDGRLTESGRFATGGRGASEDGAVVDPLASQGSLTYDAAHHLLYAVNAGSDTVSVFDVRGVHLTRRQVLSSGGHFPVSVGVSHDLVYVLDAGGDGAIHGFRVVGGRLSPIAGSTRGLALGNAATPFFLSAPSQVALTPDARDVVVATKNHNKLDVFPLHRDGRPSASPVVTASAGAVPFALSFDGRGRLLVAEASGGASSYALHRDGTLSVISGHVANGQSATCWSAMARGYLFTANAGSATITAYLPGTAGVLHLRDANGVTATTGAGPVDLAASPDGGFLYQEATGAGAIDEFRVGRDGSLTLIGTVAGFPPDNGSGMEGIAAT
jgi:6-phosphogluconolactonase (cycloisomerase 2 family)